MQSTRAKAFSGAAKKKQLQEKRARKKAQADGDGEHEAQHGGVTHGHAQSQPPSRQEHERRGGGGRNQPQASSARAGEEPPGASASAAPERDKLRTVFAPEPKEEIERRIRDSRRPLTPERPRGAVEAAHFHAETITIPRRPPWSREMTHEELDASERASFQRWLDGVYSAYEPERLNFFEHNLEVWRQLWRVVEKSDVLLLVADARFPRIHFAPGLHDFVCRVLRKPAVLVLNKSDLVPGPALDAWRDFFARRYALPVARFSSRPAEEGEDRAAAAGQRVRSRRRRAGQGAGRPALGVREVLEACARVLPRAAEVLLQAAEAREEELARGTGARPAGGEGGAEEAGGGEDSGDESSSCDSAAGRDVRRDLSDLEIGEEEEEEEEEGAARPPPPLLSAAAAPFSASPSPSLSSSAGRRAAPSPIAYPQDASGVVTVGFIGPPNAGKSSLINALLGRKVVSTSRSPGHTKHFQTIHVSPLLRLCDCPGLVFPALDQPRALQVLCGVYPIAQTREPYSAVRLLAHRVPLPALYRLPEPEPAEPGLDSEPEPWSPWAICEALAVRRGFLTRGGHPDVYRAANAILRDCLDGVVPYFHDPPRDRERERARPRRAGAAEAADGAASAAPGAAPSLVIEKPA
eukprot:tig00021098_g18199.t1